MSDEIDDSLDDDDDLGQVPEELHDTYPYLLVYYGYRFTAPLSVGYDGLRSQLREELDEFLDDDVRLRFGKVKAENYCFLLVGYEVACLGGLSEDNEAYVTEKGCNHLRDRLFRLQSHVGKKPHWFIQWHIPRPEEIERDSKSNLQELQYHCFAGALRSLDGEEHIQLMLSGEEQEFTRARDLGLDYQIATRICGGLTYFLVGRRVATLKETGATVVRFTEDEVRDYLKHAKIAINEAGYPDPVAFRIQLESGI